MTGIYQIDMETGAEQYVSQYPSPEDLWNRTFAKENAWRDRFAAIPFEDKGGRDVAGALLPAQRHRERP